MKSKMYLIISLVLIGCVFLMGAGIMVENELSDVDLVSGTLDKIDTYNGVLTLEDFYAAVEKAENMYSSNDAALAVNGITVNTDIVKENWSNVTEEEYAQYRRDILACAWDTIAADMPSTRYTDSDDVLQKVLGNTNHLNTSYWFNMTILLANPENGEYESAEEWFKAYMLGEFEGEWITKTEYPFFMFRNGSTVSFADGNGNVSTVYPTDEQRENIAAIRAANGLVTE